MPNPPNWTTLGVPKEIADRLRAIARAEERANHVILRKALDLYEQQQAEPTDADLQAALDYCRKHSDGPVPLADIRDRAIANRQQYLNQAALK